MTSVWENEAFLIQRGLWMMPSSYRPNRWFDLLKTWCSSFSSFGRADASVIFGYSGSNGPDKWGSLRPEFSKCSTGKLQSPININRSEAVKSGTATLVRDYNQMTNASLVDLGFNVAVCSSSLYTSLISSRSSFYINAWADPAETERLRRFQVDERRHLVTWTCLWCVNVQVKWEEAAGILVVNRKNYTLKSMHWHTPSEHTLDGMR